MTQINLTKWLNQFRQHHHPLQVVTSFSSSSSSSSLSSSPSPISTLTPILPHPRLPLFRNFIFRKLPHINRLRAAAPCTGTQRRQQGGVLSWMCNIPLAAPSVNCARAPCSGWTLIRKSFHRNRVVVGVVRLTERRRVSFAVRLEGVAWRSGCWWLQSPLNSSISNAPCRQ